MRRVALALALLAALSAAACAAEQKVDCRTLGFSGFGLCSSCDALESAVHDAELAAECRQCCAADDGAEDAGPFDTAVLEVCPWRLSMHAELREWADEATATYGTRFKVRHKSGSPPTLVLSSKGGTPQRTRIDAWKRSAIADYLSTRLAAAPAGEL